MRHTNTCTKFEHIVVLHYIELRHLIFFAITQSKTMVRS
jgi:hypothetical protein